MIEPLPVQAPLGASTRPVAMGLAFIGAPREAAPAAAAVLPGVSWLEVCALGGSDEGGRVPEYAELKRLVTEAGLLEPRLGYGLCAIVRTGALLTAGLILLHFFDHLWLRLMDAAFLAFVFTHIGFIGHDSGHGQIFRKGWKRELVGLLHGNLLLGVSAAWWVEKHNLHHGHPNELRLDPDINMEILAFSEEQAREMRGVGRFITKYQAYLLFPLLMLEGFSLKLDSVRFLLQNHAKGRVSEALLIAAHFAWYGGLLILLLGASHALLFIVVHQTLFGLYMGSVFAPNHKGMPVLAAGGGVDFFRQQVLTARNIRGHPVTDFLYGGLNYQIEHHLFPTMARRNLKAAQRITRRFCADHAVDYHETGVLRSYGEILRYMHQVGAPLRARKRDGSIPA